MTETSTPSRWLHAWAVLTVGLVFVQLLLGSVVTTFQVGMADPVWPTAPWYLAQIKWGDQSLGYLFEHTHRAFGSVVGLAVIVLAVWLWLGERRPALRWVATIAMLPMVATLFLGLAVVKEPWAWLTCLALCVVTPVAILPAAVRGEPSRRLRWLGTVALAGVIVQGLFGGFRVCWHADMGPELSVVHGCVAQVYFGFVACLALLTRRDLGPLTVPPPGLRLWSLLTPALVFVQLVLGALLRHTLHPVWQRLHLISAFLVVLAVVALIWQVWKRGPVDCGAKRWAVFLGVLVGVQVLFGVEAFVMRFAAGQPPETVMTTLGQAAVRTVHVLVGALVLATASVLALSVRRPVPAAAEPVVPTQQEAVPELEGVA